MTALAWVEVLRAECGRSTQAAVARRLNYSPTVVNQVLKGTYGGDMDRVREVVEGALLGRTVECPVVGPLARDRCLEHQGREFAATNPQRVAIYRACRSGCPHSRLEASLRGDT